jgi:hypothetical protein
MPKVIPVPGALSKPFWDAVNEKRLVLQYCAACDKLQYPPWMTCATCGSAEKLTWKEVNGRGHIAAAIVFNPYDGYSIMTQFWLEAFQWHGVKRGEAFAFYAGDIMVGGPHPFNSSGGNLGNGRTRTAMWTDCIDLRRGTAGPRQVRVRAETALASFGPPLGGGWLVFSKYPS